MDEEESRDIRQLLSYPDGSAGSLMTTEFVTCKPGLTVERAIEAVRAQAADKETIYQAYVVDDNETLLGVVSLRDLVVAAAGRKVSDIMNPNLINVAVDEDQKEVIRVIAKYDLLALPVVDRHHHIVGIITVDDAIDVVEEETTREVQKLGGMEALEEPYMQAPFGRMLKKRAGWLSALFLGELLTATAMAYYDKEIAHAVVLAVFLPLIISSGGNSGSQATTLVIRAMAVGEVSLTDFWRVVRREIGAGLSLGLILGVIGLCRILLWHGLFGSYGEHFALIALTVGVSLIGVVMWGTLSGAALPFLLRRVGFDPASASAPLVATLVDVSGLVIYFGAASLILRGTLL
jgi:magnesium transporter